VWWKMMITKEQLRDKILNNEDIRGIDYSHITDMSTMFYNCKSLKKIPELDIKCNKYVIYVLWMFRT
jgi:hypothetical protein